MIESADIKRQPKVLFASRFPPPYNGETLCTQLTFDLLKDSIDSAYFRLNRNCAVGLAGKFSFSGFLDTTNKIFEIRNWVKKDNYDVLYLVPASSALGHIRDILLVHAVRRRVRAIIAHIHSGNFQEILKLKALKYFSKNFIDQVDHFIFLSQYLAARASGIIPDDKIEVIHNPIDEAVKFSQLECLTKLSQKSSVKRFNILFISHMIESKGYKDLADALTMLPPEMDWYAHFVGDWGNDRQRQDFEKYILNLGVASRTRIYGKITDRLEIKEMYRQADVFVLPTYYPVEAQPRSIIEAMNAATPVVATRHASIPDYVKNDSNGYLVSIRRPKEIASAIQRLQDPEKWRELALAARDTYLHGFSTAAIQEQLIELFTNSYMHGSDGGTD